MSQCSLGQERRLATVGGTGKTERILKRALGSGFSQQPPTVLEEKDSASLYLPMKPEANRDDPAAPVLFGEPRCSGPSRPCSLQQGIPLELLVSSLVLKLDRTQDQMGETGRRGLSHTGTSREHTQKTGPAANTHRSSICQTP